MQFSFLHFICKKLLYYKKLLSYKMESSFKYNYRSNIWVSENPPVISPEDSSNFFFTLFWYKLTEDIKERKLMINLFMPQYDKEETIIGYKREWVDAAIIHIAKIDKLGGFYNITGKDWIDYYKIVKNELQSIKDKYSDLDIQNNLQTYGNIGVHPVTGQLRAQVIDNGTFSLKNFLKK